LGDLSDFLPDHAGPMWNFKDYDENGLLKFVVYIKIKIKATKTI
jgi:hypothetical protein